jgi:Prp8 binding protein
VHRLTGVVQVYDLMRKEIVFSLRGHINTITSLALSPSGSHLLSTSMDDSVRIWDVQPFAPEPPPGHKGNVRLHRTLVGSVSGFENLLIKASWSYDGRKVATGGGDRICTVWE